MSDVTEEKAPVPASALSNSSRSAEEEREPNENATVTVNDEVQKEATASGQSRSLAEPVVWNDRATNGDNGDEPRSPREHGTWSDGDQKTRARSEGDGERQKHTREGRRDARKPLPERMSRMDVTNGVHNEEPKTVVST
ncbi:hypothetical protein PC128_g24003 [Phytophthora cactorum]|nr:hypothetical protein PC128_g24003 [Phytophthora cactorum]